MYKIKKPTRSMVKSVLPKFFLSENLHSFTNFNHVYTSDCGDDIACLTNETKRTSIYLLLYMNLDF